MRTARKRPLHAVRSVAAALMVAASFAAGATDVWLSGPSAISLGESAHFTGAKLAPHALVIVYVAEPSGRVRGQMVSVNANGTASYEFRATATGVYRVHIASQAGDVLATATLVVV